MSGENQLHVVGDEDPIWRLWRELPPQWRGPILGEGIENWARITENGWTRLNLTGLPELITAEMAWMAHWQAADGTRTSVLALAQLANILRRAIREGHPFPPSIRKMDWPTAEALQGWFYAIRWGRLVPAGSRSRLRVLFGFARLALLARCHDGHWWELDEWHPRCDPRIPLSSREPLANYGTQPGHIIHSWLRAAAKWHLGTTLEAGLLRWTTVSQERMKGLHRFDTWLAGLSDPLEWVPSACIGCVAQRTGQRTQATVWSSHHEAVCLRHRRWIGSPSMPSLGQLDLHTAPDIVQAGRHHRQIVQRHGRKATGAAFIWAVTMVDDWQRRGVLPHVRDRARLLFRVEPDVMLSTAPQAQAAHYPLAVRLTRLIMTPGWLQSATSGPAGWNHAASQIADQITSGYRPSTANHDAFARLLRDTESRTCEPRTATS